MWYHFLEPRDTSFAHNIDFYPHRRNVPTNQLRRKQFLLNIFDVVKLINSNPHHLSLFQANIQKFIFNLKCQAVVHCIYRHVFNFFLHQ